MLDGGSLAGKESANVLSMLRSRLQGLGLRRIAWQPSGFSSSSGEMATAKQSTPVEAV
jgi:hypothetical protein